MRLEEIIEAIDKIDTDTAILEDELKDFKQSLEQILYKSEYNLTDWQKLDTKEDVIREIRKLLWA